MFGFLRKIGRYVLSRLEERSSVAGMIAVVTATMGLAIPPGAASALVNIIVGIAGAVALLIPGGK